ncbi:toxin-antitoxin system YwqK family antitoxin [Pseudomonas sp. SMV71]|uniref:toxin-antitoxin system YwqK family antitoxin n=1 Tax=Pseudomonas sp. SMV71 TaxID=3390195 RepID=UPI003F82C911
MRSFLMVWVLGCSVSIAAWAEPFYADKPLAHPVIKTSQESGATLAFIREAQGIVGYSCLCDSPNGAPTVLDRYGDASIESVFYANLDSRLQTLIVLSRAKGQYALRGYRFVPSTGEYRRLETLQPVLERIAARHKVLNAALVQKALGEWPPYDYSVTLPRTGVAEFDALDPADGTLVGYFGVDGVPASVGQPAEDPHRDTYKKTFQQREGRWLTLTYERVPPQEEDVGSAYRVARMAWECDPTLYRGSEEGPWAALAGERLLALGDYVQGKRSGQWTEFDEWGNASVGAYENGLRQGVWIVRDRQGVSSGMIVDDYYEGRWTIESNDDDGQVSGFDTYKRGDYDGPSERVKNGEVVQRGEFVAGQQHGDWIMPWGEGRYERGVREGRWTLKVGDGHVQVVDFVADKMQGELREVDAAGVLRLVEHYRAGVLDGVRQTYAANGKLTYSASYANGQVDGRALTYSDDGAVLRSDITWRHGVKEGVFRLYHPNGQPDTVATYEADEPIGNLQSFDASGVLIADRNYCHVPDGQSTRIQPCGRQRGAFNNGQFDYESDYLFGNEQSARLVRDGRTVREVLLGPDDRVTRNEYYPNGQLKSSEARQGFRLITVEGRSYKDYSYARREGEAVYYYPTGVVERRMSFKDDKIVGCYTGYDENGIQNFPPPGGCPPRKPVVFNFGE